MSEKIAKTICCYARERGHSHLRLEKQGSHLVCACGHGQKTDFLRLDPETESSIMETFRRLAGAAADDLFADRRFKIADTHRIISGRATLLPSAAGEKLLITLSSETPDTRRLSGLGLFRDQQTLLRRSLKKSGLIIVAAAEENGATSTYYSLLTAAATGNSAYSLEEYPLKNLEGVNILNLKKYAGVSAAVDRLLLLDSNIIGVDAALCPTDWKTLIRGAASGRLIIATLQAQTAAEAVKIMRHAGVSADDIANRVILISAQKLFSKPCAHCLQACDPGNAIKENICRRWPLANSWWPKKLYKNRGCHSCRQEKKQTYTAVFELMHFLSDGSLADGYQPLLQGALSKASLGLINIEDIAAWANTKTKV